MEKKIIIRSVKQLSIIALCSAFLGWLIFHSDKKDEDHALTVYGNVDIREVDLAFRVMGKVESLYFDEGDKVKPGDLLAVLDKGPYVDKLRRAKGELSASKISASNAKSQLIRRDKAVVSLAVSKEDADNARANYDELKGQLQAAEATASLAETELSDTNLICPSSGTILTRIKEKGSVVAAGEAVFTVALESPLWVRCYVAEPDLGTIYPGMEAEIITDTKNHPSYKGHIGFISPIAEFTPKNVETQALRTDLVFRLRVIVENPDEGLRQGMPVTVILKNKKERSS